VIVRDFFEKISHYVRKFTDVVDVAVQCDRAHAALPWAGNTDVVKAMFVYGGDMNALGNKNGPSLAITIHGECNSVLSPLLDHGANVW
jgi:hypothetical protein